MIAKTRVTLTPEQETLLIPLYAKAQPENPLFFDPQARGILDQVDYNFARLRAPFWLSNPTEWYYIWVVDWTAVFGEWITVRSNGTTWICRR